MGRSSIMTSVGRAYQNLSPVFSPADYVFTGLSRNKINNPPLVCILAPPRSGSTLSYQLLTTGIKGFYLSNIWNLLYATPAIGGVLSKKITNGRISDFKSQQGFVEGLAGEAEGLRFWKYWSGQSLEQNTSSWKVKKAERLKAVLGVVAKHEESFITGYLGHVFCIDQLKATFPNIVFVHLQRNLLANARSIYNADPENWFSSKPQFNIDINTMNRYEQIAKQLIRIHTEIDQQRDENFIELRSETLAREPLETIKNILDFAKSRNISLRLSDNHQILNDLQFNIKGANKNKDKISNCLYQSLQKEIDNIEEKRLKSKLLNLLND